jgi:hypothetical protein
VPRIRVLSRWGMRIAFAFASMLVVFSWLRQKIPMNPTVRVRQFTATQRIQQRKQPRRPPFYAIKVIVPIAVATATLIFAYLAVAVSAHWFPW